MSAVEGLEPLCQALLDLKDVLASFSKGDFSKKYRQTGSLAGYVKALQSNIRHLAWQCVAVADGDLTQQVDFMGELSEAFNRMTASLAAKHEEIQQKQEQLTELTRNLQQEIKKKEEIADALRASEEMYRERSLHDPMTGLYNRAYFFESAAREMDSIKRQTSGRACIVMMDIDHFKRFNDTYGHICGDAVIKLVASSVSGILRKSDIFARYGGEEFVIFLANANLETGSAIAERIRATVEAQPSPAPGGQAPVTISVGLCSLTNAGVDSSANCDQILMNALAAADAALYQAKDSGRNRVCVAAKASL